MHDLLEYLETTPPTPNYTCEEVKTAPPSRILPDDAQALKMTINKKITPESHDRDIRHYEFDLANTGIKYEIGDSLAIYPHNDKDEVANFLKFYGLNPDSVINIKPTGSVPLNPRIPSTLSIKQLFTEVLDIFGRPSRRFYRTLSRFAKGQEQTDIQNLVKPSGMKAYQELVGESVTYADILKKFPSAHPDIPALIELITPIKPRYYSIASSQRMHPTAVQLCIVWVDWKTNSGKMRYGLTTSYLRKLQPGDIVSCSLRKSAFSLPPTPQNPIIMAGMGTGMAPFRAFIEDRAMMKRAGKQIGPIALFFGCRYRARDYLYVDELEQYAKEGVLTHLVPACSRDQEYKIYVQNRIEENATIVHNLMLNKDGYFYMCGPAKNVPQQIRKAVQNSFVKAGGMTDEKADQVIVDLQVHGKYNIEAY